MTVTYTEQLTPASYMSDAPPKLQLYANTAGVMGAAVGSPIVGVVDVDFDSVWDFDVTAVAVGNYFAEIQDVSNPNAPPYLVRKTATQFYETSVVVHPTPSDLSGMCSLLVDTTQAGSRVWAKLADDNNSVSSILVDQSVVEAVTDSSGDATLVLIQYGQFTSGGSYRIRVADTNRVITHNLLVRMPDASSANLEELTPL